MHTIEDILGMIATEAAEETFEAKMADLRDERKKENNDKPFSFRYNLELVRSKDGSVYWANYKEEKSEANPEEYESKK